MVIESREQKDDQTQNAVEFRVPYRAHLGIQFQVLLVDKKP